MGIYSYRFLNEGEQAREHLKKKQEALRKADKEEEERNSRNWDRFSKLDSEHKYDPKYKTTRTIKRYRDDYDERVMPSASKLEKEYDKKEEKRINNQLNRQAELRRINKVQYLEDADENKLASQMGELSAKYTHDRKKAAKAKHESALFESVHFLND